MVNDSLPDPLSNPVDGSQPPGILLEPSRQGLRSQLLQRDSDTSHDLLLSKTLQFSEGYHGKNTERDEDEEDDDYEDDEATSETQPVLMSKSSRLKATNKRSTSGEYTSTNLFVFLSTTHARVQPCGILLRCTRSPPGAGQTISP